MKINKITNEELEDLSATRSKMNNVLSQIGLKEIEKNKLKEQYKNLNTYFQGILSQLESKYGKVQINIESGEIINSEKSKLKK